MTKSTAQKVSIVVGVASATVSLGNVAVKAGPALQTLNNITNTAEFNVNNTYGQSFSVDGIVQANVTPFASSATGASSIGNFTAGTATLNTGFSGTLGSFSAVTVISAQVATPTLATPLSLNAATLAAITLTGNTGTQTIGASISSTLFGPSTVKGSTSFTNQLINDLSAF